MLQLSPTPQRIHCVRCPVTVHQFSNQTLAISYQGRLLARYDAAGGPLKPHPNKKRTGSAQGLASKAVRRLATHCQMRPESTFSHPHLGVRVEKSLSPKPQTNLRRTPRMSDSNPIALPERTSLIVRDSYCNHQSAE
jgi:hypothetical protein